MAGKGGARPGAGRPKGSISEETRMRMEMRRQFVEMCNAHAKQIFDAMLQVALGHWTEVRHPETGQLIRIAKTKPNPITLEYLGDQIMGRATQPIVQEDKLPTLEDILADYHEDEYDEKTGGGIPREGADVADEADGVQRTDAQPADEADGVPDQGGA